GTAKSGQGNQRRRSGRDVRPLTWEVMGALGWTRTPNLLIRRYLSGVQRRPDRFARWDDRGPVVRICPPAGGCCPPGWLPRWLPATVFGHARARLLSPQRAHGSPLDSQVRLDVGLVETSDPFGVSSGWLSRR